MRSFAPVTLITLLGALASSCAALRPAPQPMPVLRYPYAADPAPCLLVLLPGRWDRMEDFSRRGFLADLRGTGLAIDAVAVDAHLGYYRRGTVLERLRNDVVGPARAAGYRQLWLVGISLGGTGAILYDFTFPGEVDGLLVLAPFLGEPAMVGEVASAGGVRGWNDQKTVGKPYEADLWRWAKRLTAAPDRTTVLLGYGVDDEFAPAHRLLAEVLPREHVFPQVGGHHWAAWRLAWQRFLASGALAGCSP